MVPCWESCSPKGLLPEQKHEFCLLRGACKTADTSNIEKQLSLILSSSIAPLTESAKYTIVLFVFLFFIHKQRFFAYPLLQPMICLKFFKTQYNKLIHILLWALFQREFWDEEVLPALHYSGWVGTVSQQLPPSFSVFVLTSDRSQLLDKVQNPQYL